MACLGPQNASKILAGLNEDEVDRMTLELSSLGTVDTELKSTVLDEFYQMAVAKQYVAQGGLDMAKELLERSFGPDKAFDILNRLQASLQEVPFQFLKRADPGQVSTFIQDEHPQTIALIVAHLDPGMGALILSALGPDVQSDVIMRIATMDRTAPEIVREVERVIERKMAAVFTGGFTFAGGVKAVAEILNRVERTSEKAIMADLGDRDPELADEIGRQCALVFSVKFVGRPQRLLETKHNCQSKRDQREQRREDHQIGANFNSCNTPKRPRNCLISAHDRAMPEIG